MGEKVCPICDEFVLDNGRPTFEHDTENVYHADCVIASVIGQNIPTKKAQKELADVTQAYFDAWSAWQIAVTNYHLQNKQATGKAK